jgi:hypothetical protein
VLSGTGSAAAVSMLTTIRGSAVSAADISRGFLLTRIVALLAPNATVDQVNAAARSIGAERISTSTNGIPVVTLDVPRQASIAALKARAKTLAAQPGIAFAFAGREPKASVLPEQAPGVAVPPPELSHLLATRFPQAWNARSAAGDDCLPRSVPVLVLDKFGTLVNRPDFLTRFDADSFVHSPDVSGDEASGHGYDVALTIAAKFDAAKPTGAQPFDDCVLLHQLEAAGLDFNVQVLRLRTALLGVPGSVVINNSLNFSEPLCGPNGDEPCTSQNAAATPADDIREAIRERIFTATLLALVLDFQSTENRVLVTVSAGNHDDLPDGFFAQRYPGFRDGRFSNMFALATQLSEIDILLQDPALWRSDVDPSLPDVTFDLSMVADLHAQWPVDNANLDPRSVLIVDSAQSSDAPGVNAPSAFNFLGAEVRAVGENVPLDTGLVEGTSFAAPQVAGLAAYLWTLSDALRGEPSGATGDLIRRTSVSAAGAGLLGVPLLDAYAATLALDRPNGTFAIRRALLDANEDGVFDHLDLQLFATAYRLGDPSAPTIPSIRDWSRFDLNGDAYTGGILIAPFDLDVGGLDVNGLPSIESVDATIEGYLISFNEAALSDLQILCYYAYSSATGAPAQPRFYDGRQEALEERTAILGPEHCVGVRVDVDIPSAITSSAPLDVTVSVPAGGGNFTPAPGIFLDLAAQCGTVNPANGQTNTQGRFGANVTPDPGCSEVRLDVVARAAETEPALAQTTVTVQVLNQSPATLSIGATGGRFQANARAIGDGDDDLRFVEEEVQTAVFSLGGSTQAGVGGASASVTFSATSELEADQTSLRLRISGQLRAQAAADESFFTGAGAGGGADASLELSVMGGPMRFVVSGGAFLPNGGCGVTDHGTPLPVAGTLEPGSHFLEFGCGGGVSVGEGSVTFDEPFSAELRVFR